MVCDRTAKTHRRRVLPLSFPLCHSLSLCDCLLLAAATCNGALPPPFGALLLSLSDPHKNALPGSVAVEREEVEKKRQQRHRTHHSFFPSSLVQL